MRQVEQTGIATGIDGVDEVGFAFLIGQRIRIGVGIDQPRIGNGNISEQGAAVHDVADRFGVVARFPANDHVVALHTDRADRNDVRRAVVERVAAELLLSGAVGIRLKVVEAVLIAGVLIVIEQLRGVGDTSQQTERAAGGRSGVDFVGLEGTAIIHRGFPEERIAPHTQKIGGEYLRVYGTTQTSQH